MHIFSNVHVQPYPPHRQKSNRYRQTNIYSQTPTMPLFFLISYNSAQPFSTVLTLCSPPPILSEHHQPPYYLLLPHYQFKEAPNFQIISDSFQEFQLIDFKMFKAVLEESDTFKKLVESIKEIVKLVNIDINPEGMCIQAMDSSHVALVLLKLEERGFTDFRCEKPRTLGVSVENLCKILKCANSDDSLTLESNDDSPLLKFTFESKKGDKVSEFSLNLINIDAEQLGIPDEAFKSIVSMPSSEFSKICKEFGNLSESLRIETNKESVKLSFGSEIGSGSVVLRQGSGKKNEGVSLNVEEPVNLSFACRYLNLFSKVSTIASTVVLNMSQDTPLMVEYELPTNLGYLRFYLAPKISDMEE